MAIKFSGNAKNVTQQKDKLKVQVTPEERENYIKKKQREKLDALLNQNKKETVDRREYRKRQRLAYDVESGRSKDPAWIENRQPMESSHKNAGYSLINSIKGDLEKQALQKNANVTGMQGSSAKRLDSFNSLLGGNKKSTAQQGQLSTDEINDRLSGFIADTLGIRRKTNDNDTTGRYGQGNIDLNNRKVMQNPDGSISTERSFSVNIDGKEILLPQVINGKLVSEDEAIDHYYKTGEYLGKFNTPEEANEYAQTLHNRQNWYYSNQALGGMSFQQANTINTLLGGNKAANKYIADKQQEEADVLRLLTNGLRDPSKDPVGYAEDYETLRKSGLYPESNNYMSLSDADLRKKSRQLETNLAEAQQKEAEYRDRGAEADRDVLNARIDANKYLILEEYGLPFVENYNGKKMEINPEEWKESGGYQYLRGRPDDYYGNEYEYDELLYDWINGPGSYEQIYMSDSATNEDYDKLEKYMDQLWKGVEKGDFGRKYQEGIQNANKMAQEAQGNYHSQDIARELEETNRQIELREKQRYYEENAPEGDWGKRGDLTFEDYVNMPIGDEVDEIFRYANSLPQESWNTRTTYSNLHPAQFMTDKMYEKFAAYYLSGDKESAKAYYDGLYELYLQDMKMRAKDILESEMSQNEYAPLMIASRVITQPIAGALGTAGAVASLFGNEAAKDKNNEVFYGLTRTNQNIQGTRAQVWSKTLADLTGGGETAERWGQWLNGVVYSMADNMTARGIGMGVGGLAGDVTGKLAGMVIQGVMSGEATASSMLESLQQGLDPTEAAARAFGSGIIEWITEKYSTDRFLENFGKGGIGRQIVANFIPEAQEEGLSKLLGTALDEYLSAAYDHPSEFRRAVAQYRKKGYMEPIAFRMALQDYCGELGMEALAGGISGALMGGAGAITANVTGYRQDVATGNQMINAGVNQNAPKGAQEGTKGVNTLTLIEGGLKMPVGTESRTQAEGLQAQIKNGKEVNPADIGKLTRALINDTGAGIQGTVKNILGSTIEDQLIEMGESKDSAAQLAQHVTNLIAGQYTPEDIQAVAGNENGAKILAEYRMGTNEEIAQKKEETEQETETYRSIQETVGAMLQTAEDQEAATDTVKQITDEAPVATEAEIRQATGTRTGSVTEAIADGQIKQIAGVTEVQTDEGKRLRVQFADKTDADIADVTATNSAVAQILYYAQMDGNRTTGARFTNTLLQMAQQTTDAPRLISDALAIKWAETLGRSMPRTGLSTQQAQAIRQAARQDMADAENRRIRNFREIRQGQGTTSYNGIQYGAKEFGQGLNSTQRQEAEAIGAFAKAAGFDVQLINDANSTREQGSYSADGGIVINLAGEFRDGVHRSALATFAHEVTHQIEGNSAEAYQALRQFVLNTQAKQGVNLEQRLQAIMDTYAAEGVQLDMYDALAELVAKSCEEVLTDERVIAQLQANDPALYGTVQGAVQRFIEKIRTAINAIRGTSSVYARGMRQYADELSRLWLGAYEEAKGARGTGEGRAASQMAIMENDEDIDKKIKVQINASLDMLNESDPIAEISSYVDLDKYRNAGAQSDDAAYKKWANELAEGFKRRVYRNGLGDVVFTSKSINKGFKYLDNGPQKAAFTAVPAIIQNGYEINYHEKHKGGQANSHTYAGKILLDGNPQIMAVVVRYSENENRYKTHEVFMPDGTVLKLENNKAEVANTPAEGIQQEHISSASGESITQQDAARNRQRSIQDEESNIPVKEQFSMQDPVEQNKAGLIAVHNLTEQNLIDTLEEGGFTAPSIAVIMANMGHSKFGDVSVVFKPNAIDPQASRRNKVYGTDAWTPTRSNAQIEYKLNYEVLQKARDTINNLLGDGKAKLWQNDAMNWINQWLYEDQTSDTIDEFIRRALNNDGMVIAYEIAKGREIQEKTEQVYNHPELKNSEIDQYNRFLDTLEKEGMLQEFMDDMESKTGHEVFEKYLDIFQESGDYEADLVNKYKNKPTDLSKHIIFAKMKKARWFQQDGRQIKYERRFSKAETAKAVRDTLNNKEFGKWISGLLDGALGERGVYNGSDLFTRSGNRRSFRATHDEPTAENIVRAMYANHQAKGGEAGGATGLMAKASKEYKTLDEIREDRGRLKMLDENEYRARIEELDKEIYDFAEKVSKSSKWDLYTIRELLIEAGEKYAKNTAAVSIGRYMEDEGVHLSYEQLMEAQRIIDEAREIETGYFEAKPERVVDFDEIEKVIIPADADQKLLDALDERGIPYETYDGTDEDRLKALNRQEKAKFSIQDEGDANIYYWMRSVKPENMQTEAEKQLLENFQNLDMRIDLRRKQIFELKDKIANLEAVSNPDADLKKRIQKLKVQLANAQTIKEQAEAELAKITSSEGYGRMMQNQQRIFSDFVEGKTLAEVKQAVETLQKTGADIAREIEENQRIVDELGKTDGIKRVKEILESTRVNEAAKYLKDKYHSVWKQSELRPYLDAMIAKVASVQDLTNEDVRTMARELAEVLVQSDTTKTYEGLADLEGLTITIGKSAQKELRATHRSIKDIRDALAGTGIRVRFGETSTLDKDLSDLRERYPEMPEFDNNLNAIDEFVSWVNGMRGKENVQYFQAYVDEAEAEVMGQLAKVVAYGKIYVPTDTKARQQIMDLIEYVKGLNARTENAERTLRKIQADIGTLTKESGKAAGMANVLTQHIGDALEYYDKTAKLAVDMAKQERNNHIIEQLKSEHAQKIAKNNEEWRNLIERDKNARQQAETNRKYRNRIGTVLTRTMKLLKNPQGTKNIPEHMQGLARELLSIFINNDLDEYRTVKLTTATKAQLEEAKRLLTEWEKQSGPFNIADLADAAEAVAINLTQDLTTIREGIEALDGRPKGKNRLETLQQRGDILRNMQEAASEIYAAIRKENEIQVNRRNVAKEDQAYKIATDIGNRQKKEWTGKIGSMAKFMHKEIINGNMTPEYFFRMIGNEGLSELWDNYHDAENRNGLELAKAQQRLSQIAEKHGYDQWDMNQKIKVQFENSEVELTLGQLMSLWATWKRENTLGPQMSEHLTKGGFYAEQDTREGIIGKTIVQKRATRVTAEDMQRVEAMLTDEQLAFIDDVVSYMSNDMSALGNEASMAAFGIKLYKEKFYFPFQMWDGVRSRKSNDSGAGANIDRAFHPSFSKTRMHGANNALVIGDFMQTASDHIVGMINYATMGLANESLQKTLNTQLDEGGDMEYVTRRNVWTMLEEAYGAEAVQYLRELQQQLNGGAVRTQKDMYDKLLSMFRKNAVAGSLSVAFQQPLSYIRAAVLINPKYLAKALTQQWWSGAYDELMQHSGVAVIKDMGKFDMNAGQSAREYIKPDGKQGTLRKIYEGASDAATKLPEKMDAWTWTRMWVAVKAEQHELHPEMDVKSDEFLNMCGERFNEIMRRTQVYDSVLVRSANMRSDSKFKKSITSFMAEPTLTLNVLADAVRSAKQGEKGSAALLAKALTTFGLSAVMQSVVKAIFSSGRSPDDKKTWEENVAGRFVQQIINEGNPISLIPGYSDLVTLLKKGKLEDDALGAVGKLYTAGTGMIDLVLGKESSKGLYRDIEDTAGQIMQLFTNIPAKNIMRELRAMYNWFLNDEAYANRETNANVIKYTSRDALINADNLLSLVLKQAGYSTTTQAYYNEIYEAAKAGDEQKKADLIDYLLTGKGVKEKSLTTGVKGIIKDRFKEEDISREEAEALMKNMDPGIEQKTLMKNLDEIEYRAAGGEAETYSAYTQLYEAIDKGDQDAVKEVTQHMLDNGYTEKEIRSQVKSHIKEQYKDGALTRKDAEAMLKQADPEITAKSMADMLDEIDYRNAGGKADTYSNYTPLHEAIDANNTAAIEKAKKRLIELGYTEKNINSEISSYVKGQYKDGALTRNQAEAMLKKANPQITQKDLTRTLDEIDYERKIGHDVDSYSMYTPLHDALDKGSRSEVTQAVQYLKKNGYEEKNINNNIRDYITDSFRDGKITRAQAESRLKDYAGMEEDDVWWAIDRIDFQKKTGKDPGGQTYYRLWDAMDNNKADSIGQALDIMLAHGIKKENVKSTLSKGDRYKEAYLNGSEQDRVRIRDAYQKAYKKLGYSAAEADKAIANWSKKKKK